jgi:hypothetical protein
MLLWLFIGPIIGGGLGWFLGRYNRSRAAADPCETTAAHT